MQEWTSFEDFTVPIILGGAYIASALVVWKLWYYFTDIRGNSGTRKDLRNWLMRKYVWFGEKEHINSVKNTEIANG